MRDGGIKIRGIGDAEKSMQMWVITNMGPAKMRTKAFHGFRHPARSDSTAFPVIGSWRSAPRYVQEVQIIVS